MERRWRWFLPAMGMALILRLLLIMTGLPQILVVRPEVATPLTSLRRLAEGQWLKQLSISPYAGSMYHGSPLLLAVLGPLTVSRTGKQTKELFCRFFGSSAIAQNWTCSSSIVYAKQCIVEFIEVFTNPRKFRSWRCCSTCIFMESFGDC